MFNPKKIRTYSFSFFLVNFVSDWYIITQRAIIIKTSSAPCRGRRLGARVDPFAFAQSVCHRPRPENTNAANDIVSSGKLAEALPTQVVIDVNGVGYYAFFSGRSSFEEISRALEICGSSDRSLTSAFGSAGGTSITSFSSYLNRLLPYGS